MKIETRQELEKLIATADKSDTIVLDEDLEITFNCEIPYNIRAYNIEAGNIKARNIQAHNIKAYDIYADNIKAYNIQAHNIKAYDIYADNINAYNIEYDTFCIACRSLKCKSISGRRRNSLHKCLDQEIEIIKKEKKVTIELTQSQIDKIKHLI